MARTCALILVAWTLVGSPTFCQSGLLDCLCDDAHDCPLCPPATCSERHDCHDDPCRIDVLARDPSGEDAPAITPQTAAGLIVRAVSEQSDPNGGGPWISASADERCPTNPFRGASLPLLI